jgi:hypothetical protein
MNGDANLRMLTRNLISAQLNANQKQVNLISQRIADGVRRRLMRNITSNKKPTIKRETVKNETQRLTSIIQRMRTFQSVKTPTLSAQNKKELEAKIRELEANIQKLQEVRKKKAIVTETSNTGTQTQNERPSRNEKELQLAVRPSRNEKELQLAVRPSRNVRNKLVEEVRKLNHPLVRSPRIQKLLLSGKTENVSKALLALTHSNFNTRVSPVVMKSIRNIQSQLTAPKANAPLMIEPPKANAPLMIEPPKANAPLMIEPPKANAPLALKAPSRAQQLWRSVNTTRRNRLFNTVNNAMAKNVANKAAAEKLAAERAAIAMAAAKQRMKTLKFNNIAELNKLKNSVKLPNNNENYRAALNRLKQKKVSEATKKFDKLYNELMRRKYYIGANSVTSFIKDLEGLVNNVNQARQQKYESIKNLTNYAILMGKANKVSNPNVKEAYHIAKKGWNSKEHTQNHVKQFEKLQKIYNTYYNNKGVPKLGRGRDMNLLRGNKTLTREASRPIILFGGKQVRAAIYQNKANEGKKYAIPQEQYTLYRINGTAPSGKYQVIKMNKFGSNIM